MADLKESERDDVAFAFQIYETDKNKLDGITLGKVLNCCNLNPSLETLEAKYGIVKKPGQKFLTVDEVCNIYSELKKEKKDQGCYEDFVECLKLYDKDENGRMLVAELSHSLLSLGEKLTDPQVDELFTDCLPEEDDDGYIEYDIFLRKMCDRPPK